MTETKNFECTQSGCPVKETGECLETHKDLKECPHFKLISDPIGEVNKQETEMFREADQERVPFSGDEIYDDELTKLTARYPATLNLLMGDSEGGKTTLIAALYDLFQKGPVGGYNFAGSRTQLGFEKRCFLARWTSAGRTTPVTEHTAALNMHYLHLSVRDIKCKMPIQHVLFTDVSGEQYRIIRDHENQMQKFTAIRHADNIFYIANGQQLLDGATKHKVKSNTKKLLDRGVHTGQIDASTPINFIITNLDKITGSEDQIETFFSSDIRNSFNAIVGDFL